MSPSRGYDSDDGSVVVAGETGIRPSGDVYRGDESLTTHWTLEDLYHGIMRSWWALVGMIVVCATAAAGVWFVFPQTYTALAQHTVEPINVISSGSSFNTVNMETERVVATSTAVLERASEELGGADVGALREATIIQVPRNSQVLEFEVTTRDPGRSADWANALAAAYGEQRIDNARTVVEQTANELTGSIQQLQTLLDAQPEGSSERAATQQQLQALLDQQARLTATPFFAGILVTPANVPSESNRPGIYVFVAAGLFLGLLLGAVLALIISRARSASARTYQRGRHAAVKAGASGQQVEPLVPEGATVAVYADDAADGTTSASAERIPDADLSGPVGAAAEGQEVSDAQGGELAPLGAGDGVESSDPDADAPIEPVDDLEEPQPVLAREKAVTSAHNR